MSLSRCPFCGSDRIADDYVFMRCIGCGARGPFTNGGNNDDHADYLDREKAIELWNARAKV